MVQNWTFTTRGSLSGGYYFERINTTGNPNDASTVTLANGGGTYAATSIVDMGFLELVRQGVMTANSPYITLSLPAADSVLKQTANGNAYWYRYNHDGYGERSDGSNYNGTGIGRLWPIFSGECGIYDVADGIAADWALTAMTASENASGFIPEQVWDTSAPTGYTPGTPTKSMNDLNWAMGEFITLLFSANSNTIADGASVVLNRYVTTAYQPHSGFTIDYNSAQANPGKALTIYYKGPLASQSKVFLHWGENNWQNIPPDPAMVKRADGFWQVTISVPNDATQINIAVNNGAGTWDNNGGSNYNITISGNTCAIGGAVAATGCRSTANRRPSPITARWPLAPAASRRTGATTAGIV